MDLEVVMSKENTFRTLANQPLIADRWSCRLGWHKWSQWAAPQKDQTITKWTQSRHCVDCNRFEILRLKEEYK